MEWSNDPTVRGMLTMLDEIQKRLPILMTYGTNWIKLISISAILRR